MLETPVQNRTFHALDWHATMVERASASLAHFIQTTAEDRRSWAPTVEGATKTRSCYELASECIAANRRTAALINGVSADTKPVEINDMDSCARELLASGKELADVLRSQDDTLFTREFQLPFGPITGTVLIEITLGNLHYHIGQVNMIQLLSGDPKFHVPANFLTFVPTEIRP